jgi:Sec-independent protein translocase protein TatA
MTCRSSDIVERLREVGVHLGNAIAGYRDDDLKRAAMGAVEIARVTREAAAEIEQLRAEIRQLRQKKAESDAKIAAYNANVKPCDPR